MTERRVEMKYPSQSITAQFTQHVKDTHEYIDREDFHGQNYSSYYSLQLVLDTLHATYHLAIKQRCEREFHHNHDMDDELPFKLRMPQMGTSLTTWAEELRLNDRRSQRIIHVTSPEPEAHFTDLLQTIGQMDPCSLCEGPHYDTSCHKFINHVMGEKFLKKKDAIIRQIKLENTTFIKSKPRPHNGQCATPGIRLIEDEPSPHDDETLSAIDHSVHTLRLSLIVDTIVANEHIFICDDGGSCCASVDSKEDFDYVRTVNFEDFDPSLGTSYDVNLLDIINANWDNEMDPTHTLRTLSGTQTSHLPRTNPPDE
jgi:hypothetical protein